MKKIRRLRSSFNRTSSPSQVSSAANGPSESFVNEIVTLFNAQELGLLEQKAKEAIQRWPKHPLGWKALGNLLLSQGRPAEALDPLSNTVKLAPSDTQAQHNLGIAFLELGRYGEAEEYLRQALAINPDYAQAHCNLGVIFLEVGNFEEAEASFRQALATEPDFFLKRTITLATPSRNSGDLKRRKQATGRPW